MEKMVKKQKIPLHLFVVLSKIAFVDIIVPYLCIKIERKREKNEKREKKNFFFF